MNLHILKRTEDFKICINQKTVKSLRGKLYKMRCKEHRIR